MMSALSQLYNQSLGNVSRMPLPSQIKKQGWILWQVGFGGVVPFSTSESLTPCLFQLPAHLHLLQKAWKPLKSVPMSNLSMRLSMASSLPSFWQNFLGNFNATITFSSSQLYCNNKSLEYSLLITINRWFPNHNLVKIYPSWGWNYV